MGKGTWIWWIFFVAVLLLFMAWPLILLTRKAG